MPDLTQQQWMRIKDGREAEIYRMDQQGREPINDILQPVPIIDRLWVASHALLLPNGPRRDHLATTDSYRATETRPVLDIPDGFDDYPADVDLRAEPANGTTDHFPFLYGKVELRLQILQSRDSRHVLATQHLIDLSYIGPNDSRENVTEITKWWNDSEGSRDRSGAVNRASEGLAEAIGKGGTPALGSLAMWIDAYRDLRDRQAETPSHGGE